MAGWGAGCGVGHVAHAAGCSFFFFALLFRFLFGVFGVGRVLECFGIWGRVMFALVSAFYVFRGGWLFGARKSTSIGCFWGGFGAVLGSMVAFWVPGWVGAGCVLLFFGVFGGGAGCVCGGVVLWVFRYVGEPNVCPCQCVMHFGASFCF